MTVIRDWYLEINSVPLATYAWEVTNLSALLDSAALRGTDRLLPGAAGVRPNRRRRGVQVVTLPLEVHGDFDEAGDPITEPLEGVVSHLEYLTDSLGFASPTGDGTVPAVFHRGGLPDLAADVHFLGFQGSEAFGEWSLRTTFDISIPAGAWEEVGS